MLVQGSRRFEEQTVLVEGLGVDFPVPLIDSFLFIVVELHIDLDFQLLLRIFFGVCQLLPLENGSLGDS